MITKELLCSLFPSTSESILESYVEPLNSACDKFEINNSSRVAMFIAQIGHESGGLKVVHENLNYKAEGLIKIFPKYFRDADPNDYAHQPEKIANRVYANRMGNGDEESGDGYRYRGRGLIQLTGHDNYQHFANDVGMSIEEAVEYLETPDGATMSAAWFWNTRHLNDAADAGDIVGCTKKINGGTIGLEDRTHHYEKALSLLG